MLLLAELLRSSLLQPVYHGEHGVRALKELGRNYPLQAALLGGKLRRLDDWNARRRRIAAVYLERLSGIDGLSLPELMVSTVPELSKRHGVHRTRSMAFNFSSCFPGARAP